MRTRDQKWQRIEPGHEIPAGQPYAIEFAADAENHHGVHWAEYVSSARFTAHGAYPTYVDRTWQPPVNIGLPTEPTWGILVRADKRPLLDKWVARGGGDVAGTWFGFYHFSDLVSFAPLTDAQVKALEAAL